MEKGKFLITNYIKKICVVVMYRIEHSAKFIYKQLKLDPCFRTFSSILFFFRLWISQKNYILYVGIASLTIIYMNSYSGLMHAWLIYASFINKSCLNIFSVTSHVWCMLNSNLIGSAFLFKGELAILKNKVNKKALPIEFALINLPKKETCLH